MQATRKNTPAFLTTTVPPNNRQRYLAYQRRLARHERRNGSSWRILEASNAKQLICEAVLAIALVLIGLAALPYLVWI